MCSDDLAMYTCLNNEMKRAKFQHELNTTDVYCIYYLFYFNTHN